MRRVAVLMVIATLTAASACGSGSDDSAASTGDDGGLNVCGLVSDDTVKELQATSVDPQGEPIEVLMRGAETFVECQIISDVKLGFAVRAVAGGPGLESMFYQDADTSPAPLEGVGDTALIGANSYDGVRIVARVGEQELVVDSESYDGGDLTRDDVVDLAKEVAGRLGPEKPAAVRLPEACPSTTSEEVRTVVGVPVLARGATSDGSVRCSYASGDRVATLSSTTVSEGWRAMALGDSSDDRLDVDGDTALYDESDGVTVFKDDGCVLGASASPLGWTMADRRPEAERRDEVVELVRYVGESIGCP